MADSLRDYEPIATLGVGASGKVKLARHKLTSQLVALKFIRKQLLHNKPHLQLKIRREIAIMKLVAANSQRLRASLGAASGSQHVGIMHLIDVLHTRNSIVLVLEYCEGGELFDYLVRKGHLPPAQLLHFFQQLLFALRFCHRRGVCHRDLKPENVLLTADGRLKLADFGMAAINTPGALMATSCGSPQYCAPEVLLGEPYDGCAADVWSLGVVLFAMTTGGLPFDDDNLQRLISKIQSGAFYMPPEVAPPLAQLLRAMLCVDATKRITLQQIVQLPWFNSQRCRADVYRDEHYALACERGVALCDAPPLHTPDAHIVRYLADLGLGDIPTLRRRLASAQRCLERDIYYQFGELQPPQPQQPLQPLRMEQVEEHMATSPLSDSHDSSPRTSDGDMRGEHERLEQQQCGKHSWERRHDQLDADVRWLAQLKATLPCEGEHDCVRSRVLQVRRQRSAQVPLAELALR